ncbi:MAG: fibronectin type III domain-containing protein [Reichenbachiella sp.]
MSIKVTAQPYEFALAKNPMYLQLVSTDSAIDTLVVDVYVETSFGSDNYEHAFSEVLPISNQSNFYFQINQRLSSFLSAQLPSVSAALETIYGTVLRYQIKAAEKTSTSLLFVGAIYHTDKSGIAPAYYEEVALPEIIDAIKGTIVLETTDFDMITDVELSDGTTTISFDTSQIKNGKYYLYFDDLTAGVWDRIVIPAEIDVKIYTGQLIFDQIGNIFHAWLAGVNKSQIDNQNSSLNAPSNLVASNPTDTTIDLSWVNNGDGSELGFSILVGTSPSNIVEVDTTTNTYFTIVDLNLSTLYFMAVEYIVPPEKVLGPISEIVSLRTTGNLNEISFYTNCPATETFSPSFTYTGSDLPYFEFENGSTVDGSSISLLGSANGLDGSVQLVKFKFLEESDITSINLSDCAIFGTLDFSGFELTLTSALFNTNTSLFEIVFGANSSISDTFNISNTGLSGLLNLANVLLNNASEFNAGQTGIQAITFDPASRVSILNLSLANIEYFDFNFLDFDSMTSILLNGNNMTAAEVNEYLFRIDYYAVSGTTAIFLHGTNAAPDGSSGGYDGLTAKSNLISKGYTLFTN